MCTLSFRKLVLGPLSPASVSFQYFRQCATNQYLRKRDDPHRYCQGPCAEITKCGPVVVPERHLQVGFTRFVNDKMLTVF